MTAVHLIRRLRPRGVALRIEWDCIDYRGVLTDDDVDQIRRCKPQVLALLRSEQDRRHPALMPGSVSAVELRRHVGWTTERFSRTCQRLIRRPGPSTADEDRQDLDSMLATIQEHPV